ncbi:MAG: hypothetical protein QM775_14610, partial [Pirellulales bacterium]
GYDTAVPGILLRRRCRPLLLHSIETPIEVPTFAAAPGGAPITADAAALPTPVDAQPVLSQAQVEQIVADYLTKRDAEKKAADDGWYAVGTDTALTAKWNHGLELQSKNKDFKVHVGGRTQFDTSFFNNDAYLEVPSSWAASTADSAAELRSRSAIRCNFAGPVCESTVSSTSRFNLRSSISFSTTFPSPDRLRRRTRSRPRRRPQPTSG